MEQGRVHIYCGEGKGKTSAALGLALRACGAGLQVTVARFLKDAHSGEVAALSHLPGVRLLPAPDRMKFLWDMTEEEKSACAKDCQALLRAAIDTPCDVMILDEIIPAIGTGLIPENMLLTFLDQAGPRPEVVLTGRDPSPALLKRADYISEILCRRHPYNDGLPARRGIEY